MLQPHIKIEKADPFCILTGNPDRVPTIASHLKDSEEIARHRGLIAMRGYTPKLSVPVTILTSGMGSGSSGIILEETYRAGGRNLFRIGSTGSLQEKSDMGIGSIFIPFAAIQDEGTSIRLLPPEVPAVAHPVLFNALSRSAEELAIPYHSGLVWSTDIYYPNDRQTFKKWIKYGATCVEMESSMMFRFCASKNYEVRAATILTSDGNLNESDSIYTGDTGESLKKFDQGVARTIKISINAIENLVK